ncbi:MAG: hypothetical protein ABUL44_04980, partial [Flavobacterium sp.]
HSFFKNSKSITGVCQFKRCKNKDLDTVHLNETNPNIFIRAAKKSTVGKINKLMIFDIYVMMRNFLHYHSHPKSIVFLCKRHHQSLHNAERES